MLNGITYPFPNFNGATLEFCDWIVISANTLLTVWLIVHAVDVGKKEVM